MFQTGAEMAAYLEGLSPYPVGLEEVVSVGSSDLCLRLTLPTMYTRKTMLVTKRGITYRKTILRCITLCQSGAELNAQTYSINFTENCIEIKFGGSQVYIDSFFDPDKLNSPFTSASGTHSLNWEPNDIPMTRNAIIDLTASGNIRPDFNCKVPFPLRHNETAIGLDDAFIAGCTQQVDMALTQPGGVRPSGVIYWYVFDVELESRDAQQTLRGSVYVPPFVSTTSPNPDQGSTTDTDRSKRPRGGGDQQGGGFGFPAGGATFAGDEDRGSVGLLGRLFGFLFGGN